MEVVDQNKEMYDADYSSRILQYMEKYPNFYFKSSRLAKKTGLSSQKVSKLLLDLHRDGLLHRINIGKSRITPYYKIKL
jgi:Fic family protein